MIIKGSLNTGNEEEKLKVLLNYKKIEEYKEDEIPFEFEEQKKIKSKRTGLSIRTNLEINNLTSKGIYLSKFFSELLNLIFFFFI